jgi:hypothetical protein
MRVAHQRRMAANETTYFPSVFACRQFRQSVSQLVKRVNRLAAPASPEAIRAATCGFDDWPEAWLPAFRFYMRLSDDELGQYALLDDPRANGRDPS